MQAKESIRPRETGSSGTLHASLARAVQGIGRILAIHVPSLPPGYSLITAHDLLNRNALEVGTAAIPLLADAYVSYFGEPVAIVAGPDPLIVEELAVSVSIEVENPSLDIPRRTAFLETFSDSRIAARQDVSKGDFDRLSFSADTLEFSTTTKIEPYPLAYDIWLEALAEWDYEKLKVEVPTLWPEHVRSSIAALLEASPQDIELVPLTPPSSAELYFWFPSLLAALAASTARILKKPVRLAISSSRESMFLPFAHGGIVHMTTRWDRQAHLLGLWSRFVFDAGAYPVFGDVLLKSAIQNLMYAASTEHIDIRGFSVLSPYAPAGALEGLSSAALLSAFHVHASKAARACDKTITELMPRLMSKRNEDTFTELYVSKIAAPVIQKTDFARKHASYELIRKRDPGGSDPILKCISLAFACQNANAFSVSPKEMKSEAVLQLDRNLKVLLHSDLTAAPERLKSAISALVAEDLKIPSSHVGLAPPLQVRGPGLPFAGSAGIAIMSETVRRAADRIQKLRFRESLPLTAKAYAKITSSHRFDPCETRYDHPSFGAAVIHAEFDVRTGIFRSMKVDMNVYAGRILSRSGLTEAMREAAFHAAAACLSSVNEPFGTFLHLPLAPSDISIMAVEDPKARTARPVGFLPWMLVFSCMLGIFEQIGIPGSFSIPAVPYPPLKEEFAP